MTPERWQQIEQLYHEALERSVADRPTFLAQACGDDEALHREVESLLASHEQAGAFIDRSPDDVVAGMFAEQQTHSILGSTLGHYRISSLIGAGGMGEIYRAHDTRLDRDVAVKILPEHFADNPEALRRFEREAKAVAALSHPSILSIFDFGSEAGVSYAVMELLEGETLREALTRSAMGWRQAIEIGIAITDGLAAAHAKGIIHRDLKPENIFLTSDGQVKILDFGIARVKREIMPDAETLTSAGNTTKPGAIMGTIGYMSPEQVRSSPADAPSDIFSFGCMLHEMISGQKPFLRTTTAETIAAILKEDAPEIVGAGREIPQSLERTLKRCLEKNPEARYQSARELAADLKATGSGQVIASAPASKPRWEKQPSRLFGRLGAGLIVLAVGVAALIYFLIGSNKAIDSLAVLPLINASGDANAEYLSDGVTESLINSLAQLPGLRVMARSTVFTYKGKEVDPRKIGQELNVRAVLTGRMVLSGDDLIIKAELVNSADGMRLWGQQFNGKQAEVLSVQTEIARNISENLRPALSGMEQKRVTKRHTENTQAYQLYLKGRYFWNNWTSGDFKKGMEYFQQAIELDPSFALAYAGIADAYYGLSGLTIPTKEAMPRVRAAARKALEIDETLAEAHVSLAFARSIYDWEWDDGEREFKRAIDLNPNYAQAHWGYGLHLSCKGRPDEARREFQIAQDLDPFSLSIAVTATWPYYYAPPSMRRYDQAIDRLKKIIKDNPDFGAAHGFLGYVYAQKGMFDEALIEQNRVRQLEDNAWARTSIGIIYAISGRKNEARQVLAEVQELSIQKHVSPVLLARLYAGLGERDQAFSQMYKAFEEKEEELTLLQVDPQFDSLRSDPRFIDLVRRMNLTR